MAACKEFVMMNPQIDIILFDRQTCWDASPHFQGGPQAAEHDKDDESLSFRDLSAPRHDHIHLHQQQHEEPHHINRGSGWNI